MTHNRDLGAVERSISRLETALQIARQERWLDELSALGYNAEHLNEGLRLTELLHADVKNLQAEFGEEIAQITREEKCERSAKAAYRVTRKIAEIAFADMPAARIALHLNRQVGNWKDEAHTFYSSLLDNGALIDRMNSFGYRKIRLKDEAQKVAIVVKSKREYPLLRPSLELEQEIEIFYGWMSKFISVLKSIDAQEPEFIELYRES